MGCSTRLGGLVGEWYRAKFDVLESARPDRTEVRRLVASRRTAQSDEHLIADADVVHIAASQQRRPMQHRWNSQKVNDVFGTSWKMMPNRNKVDGTEVPSQAYQGISRGLYGAETRSLPWMQGVSRLAWRTLGCLHVEVRAHLGEPKHNQGIGRVGERYETNQPECNYKRDTFGNSTNACVIDNFEWTKSSGKLIISD